MKLEKGDLGGRKRASEGQEALKCCLFKDPQPGSARLLHSEGRSGMSYMGKG